MAAAYAAGGQARAARPGVRQRSPGVELALGLVRDPLLGPLVVVAAGGVLVELVDDRAVALPPVGADTAARALGRLKVDRLLDGFRGGPVLDRAPVVSAMVGLSQLAVELGDRIDAVDINPLIVGPAGPLAVDVLVRAPALAGRLRSARGTAGRSGRGRAGDRPGSSNRSSPRSVASTTSVVPVEGEVGGGPGDAGAPHHPVATGRGDDRRPSTGAVGAEQPGRGSAGGRA